MCERITDVSEEFDYRSQTISSAGKLWSERYRPELELYANMLVHRNSRIVELAEGGNRILDIGCGMGDLLYILRSKYKALHGIDPSADMVRHTIENLRLRNVQREIDVKQGLAEEINYEDNYFDTVLMIDTYEHIHPEYRARALSEIKRVLRPGHKLILVTPSAWAIRVYSLLDNLLMIPRRLKQKEPVSIFKLPEKSYTEVFCTRRALMTDLSRAGFQVQTFGMVSFYPAPEREGFLGVNLPRIYKHRKLYRTLKRLFHFLEKISFLNQKMIIRCTID